MVSYKQTKINKVVAVLLIGMNSAQIAGAQTQTPPGLRQVGAAESPPGAPTVIRSPDPVAEFIQKECCLKNLRDVSEAPNPDLDSLSDALFRTAIIMNRQASLPDEHFVHGIMDAIGVGDGESIGQRISVISGVQLPAEVLNQQDLSSSLLIELSCHLHQNIDQRRHRQLPANAPNTEAIDTQLQQDLIAVRQNLINSVCEIRMLDHHLSKTEPFKSSLLRTKLLGFFSLLPLEVHALLDRNIAGGSSLGLELLLHLVYANRQAVEQTRGIQQIGKGLIRLDATERTMQDTTEKNPDLKISHLDTKEYQQKMQELVYLISHPRLEAERNFLEACQRSISKSAQR